MQKISDSELKVMNVIWNKEKVTSSEIINELKHCNWSDNTIRTLIRRLTDKNVVKVLKIEGKVYKYVPLITKKEYTSFATKSFINQVFNGSIVEFLELLIINDKKSYEEVKDILKCFNSIKNNS